MFRHTSIQNHTLWRTESERHNADLIAVDHFLQDSWRKVGTTALGTVQALDCHFLICLCLTMVPQDRWNTEHEELQKAPKHHKARKADKQDAITQALPCPWGWRAPPLPCPACSEQLPPHSLTWVLRMPCTIPVKNRLATPVYTERNFPVFTNTGPRVLTLKRGISHT